MNDKKHPCHWFDIYYPTHEDNKKVDHVSNEYFHPLLQAFQSSTSATAFCQVTWGCGMVIQSLLKLVPDEIYGIQVRGHCWLIWRPQLWQFCHHVIENNHPWTDSWRCSGGSGGWWSVYDVSEVKSWSHWLLRSYHGWSTEKMSSLWSRRC